MRIDWLENDRILKNIDFVLENCAKPFNIEIMSIVLYGSKARGDRNSQNDYEFIVLVDNNTELNNFIKFTNTIRLTLIKEKLFMVKILVHTPDTFEDLLYNDKIVGTFLYMICKENIILFDRFGTFMSIKERLAVNNTKKEEEFLTQCVEFAKLLGSEKWEKKWEKTLLQFQYLKRRREM